MLPQYEDWEMNCLKTLDDLSVLRQWLERHDAPQRILDIRERLKKQILIAQAMLPPPDDDTNDDQDVTLDDYDTAILDDLSETYGSAVSAVRRPVNPPPAPVTGDEDPPEPPQAQTTSELTTVERLDKAFERGMKISLAHTGKEVGNWVLPEDERIIDIPDFKDYRDRGLLRDDEGWKEYYEEVKELVEPSGSTTKIPCKLCIQQGKPGGLYKIANCPSATRQGKKWCSLMTHIQAYHNNILITPVKCGCDGAGNVNFHHEGYIYLRDLRVHVKGENIGGHNGETYYNIHHRARKERDEAILKAHDDFANDLNEAIEMSASRRRVSLDLNA